MPHQVFICHSAKDKSVADAVCVALEEQNISCWIAPRDVLGGTEFMAEILDALESCQFVVLIFSQHANDSQHVSREIDRSVHYKKTIVPFRIDDARPSRLIEFALSNTHWLDAVQPPIERHLPELCRTVSRLIARRQPVEPQQPPQEPPSRPSSAEAPPPASKPIPAAPTFASDPPVNPIPQRPATQSKVAEHLPAQPPIATQPPPPVTPPASPKISNEAPVLPAAESGQSSIPAWAWAVIALALFFTAFEIYQSKSIHSPNELVATV